MLLQEFKKKFLNLLTPLYGSEEAQQFFFLLCEAYLDFSRIDVSLNFGFLLNNEKLQQFELALKRLQLQEPIQYIIGETYFYGNPFKVTTDTLIPRPETEELIDWIITDFKTKKVSILDIGTGSGCIAISLKDNLATAEVTAIDFSESALAVAESNATIIGTSIQFIKQDILAQKKLIDDYTIIVSNPPYVRDLEKVEMSTNVLDFEPASALFVSDSDPLIFYRKIATLITTSYPNTTVPRYLYFEINEYLAKETAQMLKELGFISIETRNDFRGKPRMMKGIWKGAN